jgi:hypothetical protein
MCLFVCWLLRGFVLTWGVCSGSGGEREGPGDGASEEGVQRRGRLQSRGGGTCRSDSAQPGGDHFH